MPFLNRNLIFALFAVIFFSLGICSAREIHVSTLGDDSNPGTQSKPLATLSCAQKHVRGIIKSGLKEPLHIVVRGGTYYMDQPLILRPEDSGTGESPVVWQAAKGETVILSGGRVISGMWKKERDGVWSISLPDVSGDWNFRQLFVDGKRAIRARFPNVSEKNPFLYATGGGIDHALIEPKLVKTSWATEPDAQINVVPQWKFFNQRNTITSVDAVKGRIDIADSERHGKITQGNWFWIEGVKEELDEAGEWYLDRTGKRLHYMPEDGKDPNHLTVIAPRLNVIVDARGEVEKKTHVAHVYFKGLQFRHTTYTLGHIEARVHTDGAVRLENAKHFLVEDCHFENIGGYALWLHLDSRRNVINRNTVLNSGGGGVLCTGARFSYMDDSKEYTSGKVAATVFPMLNYFTRNKVKHCGKIRYYGGGIHLDSRPASMAMDPGNYIGHNYFADLSRNGIFAFRNQGGNIIEYNHIHDAMQTTIDGACIHFATMNHLNAPNYILNNWLYDIWGYQQMPNGKPIRHKYTNAIFLDWDTSNTTIRDNYAYNSAGKPFKVIWDNWNVVNAGNVHTQSRELPPFVNDVGPKGKASHGIDLEANRLVGGVIHYSDAQHVNYAGDWQQESITGMAGLFQFNLLKANSKKSATITYSLPINKDGVYQLALLYKPNESNASNAKISVHHAEGIDKTTWNMKKGNRHGFAVEIGKYTFKKGELAKITITNDGADGVVVADSVAYVRVGN